MAESHWHKKVRLETFEKIRPNAYSSHSEISKLELFRGEAKRPNCLSDADIVVFDPDSNKIKEIIEIETALNPKKIIGIVLATHLCNLCRIKGENHLLKDISLKIIYKKAKRGSKKDLKKDIFEKPLRDILNKYEGSISEFIFEGHD